MKTYKAWLRSNESKGDIHDIMHTFDLRYALKWAVDGGADEDVRIKSMGLVLSDQVKDAYKEWCIGEAQEPTYAEEERLDIKQRNDDCRELV